MKLIPNEFSANNDGSGVCKFALVKKDDATNTMIYSRTWPTGHSEFETFIPKFIKAGSPLPGGNTVQEDYFAYPGSAAFGRTAYSCTNLERAEVRFTELVTAAANKALVNEDVVEDLTSNKVTTGKRGRPAVSRPVVVIPTTTTFTMKEILTVNPAYTGPSLYLAVKGDARIKVVGSQPNSGGRGKPSVVYGLA